MARSRLTEEEFEEVFADHLTRNPMVRSSFTRLPAEVRDKLQSEWYDVWRVIELEDLQAASKLFLRDPDHPLAPGRDLNKHCGRIFKVATELSRSRRATQEFSGSEWAPGDGPTRPGCPICKGDNARRILVWPFGKYRMWAEELRGPDHWQAVQAVKLLCPCNIELIGAFEDYHNVDAMEDHFPRRTPQGDRWPLDIPTIFNEDRHDRYDFWHYFLTRCVYERDIEKLGKPRDRWGPDRHGDTKRDDIVDMVWEDLPFRKDPVFEKPERKRKLPTDRKVYVRPEAKTLGAVVSQATRGIPAAKDRQLPPADRDDYEPTMAESREAKPKIVGHETWRVHAGPGSDEEPSVPPLTEELVDFPGSDEDLDREFARPPTPAEPETISKEERRRRRRAALGKD